MEFLPEALVDAEETVRFYESRLPGLGRRFRTELENLCAAINRQPCSGMSEQAVIDGQTFPAFRITSPISSAGNASWWRPLVTPAAIPTIGGNAVSESDVLLGGRGSSSY